MVQKSIENNETSPLNEIKYVPVDNKNVGELKPLQEIKRPDTLYLFFSVMAST